MKITKIDLLHSEPVEDGWRPVFVRVYTDEGVYGDGEAALSYGGIDNAAFGMLQDMAHLLIGMNPLENEKIWNKLYYGCFWGYNGGPVVFGAISAFDLAMWDIRGKKFGVPIWMLLGGNCVIHSGPMQASFRWAGARDADTAPALRIMPKLRVQPWKKVSML